MRVRAAEAVDDVGGGRASGGAQMQVLSRQHARALPQLRAPPQPLVANYVPIRFHLHMRGKGAQLDAMMANEQASYNSIEAWLSW